MRTESMLELRKFVAPEIIFGSDARLLAGRYAANLGASRALVVTDAGVRAAGWTDAVTDNLSEAGIACVVFDAVSPNPRAEQVMEGACLYAEEGCNAIIAVGGGSPMDCAKGIGIASSNSAPVLSFEGVDEVPVPGPPLICIPTTAGTSADVSQFAIITDTQRQVKIAIVSKSVVPDVALIDPVTTSTMDAFLTACTGLDALVHAIESYVSNAHSPLTDLHALEAVRLLSAHLQAVIERPGDMEARSLMMLGSLHAGLAFSNASLGAVHAMAHSLGGLLDFPHGLCNALLLAPVVAFNFPAEPERYRRIADAMGVPGAGAVELVAEIVRLKRCAGIDSTLGAMGLRASQIPSLAEKAMRDACMVTNPREPTRRDIEAIYEQAL